jgi:tRNA pseudouridine55 synthase
VTIPAGGGVLPVDKPVGPTSHDVVAIARRALGTRRVGHTGTLDPFASGLLLLVVDDATRLAPYLTGLDKTYLAEAQFGVATDSGDTEGAVVSSDEGWTTLDREAVASQLAALTGRLVQRPPVYSAKKVRGEPAHRRARRGETVVLEPVEVMVHELDLVTLELPRVVFSVRCSSGTYVRALARDLGEALGVGAHLTGLRRTGVGGFRLDDAITTDALASGFPDRSDSASAASAGLPWIAPARALERAGVPVVRVPADAVAGLVHGRAVEWSPGVPAPPPATPVAVADAHGLVAVAEVSGSRLRPLKVFRRPEALL